jgi:hypothetical protein
LTYLAFGHHISSPLGFDYLSVDVLELVQISRMNLDTWIDFCRNLEQTDNLIGRFQIDLLGNVAVDQFQQIAGLADLLGFFIPLMGLLFPTGLGHYETLVGLKVVLKRALYLN